MKISPRGSKLPQGPFLLIKNIVMKKSHFFEYFFEKKYAKKNRNEIPRRSVPITSQIDRKSYELWSKEFLSKNDFLSQTMIFKFKNEISKSKPFRFFIKHSFFDSNINLFLSIIYHSYTKTIYFSKRLRNVFQKQYFFIKCFIKNVIFLPQKCFTSTNQIFHKEKPMFYHNTLPG